MFNKCDFLNIEQITIKCSLKSKTSAKWNNAIKNVMKGIKRRLLQAHSSVLPIFRGHK